MYPLFRFFFVLFSLLVGFNANAHPHNWIALNTQFVLDDRTHLVQVQQRWEFDALYSLMTHADLMNEYGDEATGLTATAESMVRNLERYGYFSKLSLDGRPIDLGLPQSYALHSGVRDGELVLQLEMAFDIAADVSIESKVLAWRVYDPTYYIAMHHDTDQNINIVGGDATECATKLEFAEPSDDLIAYAANLDQTQTGTDGLGAYFAETAVIRCI